MRREIAAVALLLAACSASRGDLAEPCRVDGTCEGELACERGVCVRPALDAGADDAGLDADVLDAAGLDAQVLDAEPLDAQGADAQALDAAPVDAAPVDAAPVDAARDGGPGDADRDAPWDAALAPPPPPPEPESSGPIDPAPGPRTCACPGRAMDVALDWERHALWLTLPAEREVARVDLATCATDRVAIEGRPEQLSFDPHRDELVVTIATTEPSIAATEGWLATIDASTAALRAPIHLDVDPWDVVADGRGRAHVTTTHWVSRPGFVSVDLATGGVVPQAGPRHTVPHTWIELHPARDRVYGLAGGSSRIERLDLASGGATMSGDPYPGYELCGALRIDPRGRTIHTACGNVFRVTDVVATDMTWTGTLGRSWRDLAFDPDGSVAYAVGDTADLDVYDVASLTRVRTVPLATRPARVLSAHEYVVLVTEIGTPESSRMELRRHDAL